MSTERKHAGRPAARRGSALIEMVMVIPLLATIIGLTFFFGWTMTNQQHVRISSRYAAWRRVRAGESVAADELNTTFFNDRADGVDRSEGDGPDDTLKELVDAAGEFALAYPLVKDTVLDRWPRGRSDRVKASFPSEVALWQMFRGSIEGYHTRDGVEWRRGEVSYLDTIRDLFLYDLDRAVSNVPDATLRDDLRELYLRRW